MPDKDTETPQTANSQMQSCWPGTARLPAALPKKLMRSAAVKSLMGDISSQTLWRYGRDPKLEFPKPIYIYGTRYWVSGEIDDFIERQRGGE